MLDIGIHRPENMTLLSGQTIHVISKVNPLRLLMLKPSSLNSRLAKWVMLLSQYEMQFLPQKVMKGQAVAIFWLSIRPKDN